MTPPHHLNSVSEVIQQIRHLLLSAWCETGYGQIIVDSERINQKRICVTVRGSTHYRFVVSNEEIAQISKAIGLKPPEQP